MCARLRERRRAVAGAQGQVVLKWLFYVGSRENDPGQIHPRSAEGHQEGAARTDSISVPRELTLVGRLSSHPRWSQGEAISKE